MVFNSGMCKEFPWEENMQMLWSISGLLLHQHATQWGQKSLHLISWLWGKIQATSSQFTDCVLSRWVEHRVGMLTGHLWQTGFSAFRRACPQAVLPFSLLTPRHPTWPGRDWKGNYYFKMIKGITFEGGPGTLVGVLCNCCYLFFVTIHWNRYYCPQF